MKKIFRGALVMSIFPLFAAFFPIVASVQSYAAEKTDADIISIKKELEEEKESLVELNDELEYIVEQEKESQERINLLKTTIKDLQDKSQKGDEFGKDKQEELNSAKEELDAEMLALEEIKDEIDALKELKKETEDRIAELTVQTQKTELATTPRPQSEHPKEPPQQTPVSTSKLSTTSAEEPKPTKEALREQLRLAQEVLESEIASLEDIDDQILVLQDEIEEMEEQRGDTETSIHELLEKIKGLEAGLASIETKEKDQPTPSVPEEKHQESSK